MVSGADQLWPAWAVALLRRILALAPGRYQIILTVGRCKDWTVTDLGKVEGV